MRANWHAWKLIRLPTFNKNKAKFLTCTILHVKSTYLKTMKKTSKMNSDSGGTAKRKVDLSDTKYTPKEKKFNLDTSVNKEIPSREENNEQVNNVSDTGEQLSDAQLCENISGDHESESQYFNGVEISKLTKRQQKKYRKMLKWQAVKKLKRAKERVKTKNKKIEAKKNNLDLGPSRKQLKRSTMASSTCKISVVVDLSFDNLMINKDLGKVIKQILRVYTENRRSKTPMQLYLTSFEGKAKEEMGKHNGYEHWDMNFCQEDYMKIFPKEKLVYLSSESDNVITELMNDKVYIIGGLVDHNSHKGICYKKAVEQGIDHGQLPIGEYFRMKHRKVFTINQVFEVLLRVVEGKTFKEAFESTLPKRINMQPTNNTQGVTSMEDVQTNKVTL